MSFSLDLSKKSENGKKRRGNIVCVDLIYSAIWSDHNASIEAHPDLWQST